MLRPTLSMLGQPVRKLYTMTTNKSNIYDHLSRLKASDLFPKRELNHILASLPTVLQSLFDVPVKRIEVTDDHISGFNEKKAEIYRFETPVSYKDSFKKLVEKDAVLNEMISTDTFHLDSYNVSD